MGLQTVETAELSINTNEADPKNPFLFWWDPESNILRFAPAQVCYNCTYILRVSVYPPENFVRALFYVYCHNLQASIILSKKVALDSKDVGVVDRYYVARDLSTAIPSS